MQTPEKARSNDFGSDDQTSDIACELGSGQMCLVSRPPPFASITNAPSVR